MERTQRVAIYVRVSTAEQSTKLQENELRRYAETRAWVVNRVYADTISGAKDNRPALQELMAACRQRKVDVVLVWKFDRFARSLRHLVTALEEFKRLRVDFISATEGVDTTIPSGELVFQIFGAIAQFERALISERVKAGLSEARRNGKRLGRPSIKRLSPAEVELVRKERAQGRISLKGLAEKLGSSVWAIREAIKVHESAM
jgi:DNA invertase Pin-like site-specific DNA recombinase